MDFIKTSNRIITCALFLALPSACSKAQPPRLGTSVEVAATEDASVVQKNTRSILPSGGLAGAESTTVEVKAAVKAVDHSARTVTLKYPDGTLRTSEVPAEVKNFAQVKAGDQLKVFYRRTLAFELREPTEAEVAIAGSEVAAGSRAKLGQLPGAAITSSRLAIVTIDSVSTEKKEVAVKTADGSIVTIQAKYPENLALVKKGQKAVVTYGETVVAGVERL